MSKLDLVRHKLISIGWDYQDEGGVSIGALSRVFSILPELFPTNLKSSAYSLFGAEISDPQNVKKNDGIKINSIDYEMLMDTIKKSELVILMLAGWTGPIDFKEPSTKSHFILIKRILSSNQLEIIDADSNNGPSIMTLQENINGATLDKRSINVSIESSEWAYLNLAITGFVVISKPNHD